MKHILVALFLFSGCISLAQSTFTITGNLKNIPDGCTITLFHTTLQSPITTTDVKLGKFTLTGSVATASIGRINISKDKLNTGFDIFLGNEKLTITGDVKQPKKIQIKGGKHKKAFDSYSKEIQPQLEKLTNLVTVSNKYAGDPTKQDSVYRIYSVEIENTKAKVNNFVKNNNGSPVAMVTLYNLKSIYESEPTVIKDLLSYMSDEAATSPYYNALSSELESKLFASVGTIAPDFLQNDTANKPIKLSDFKGKYVLLDFWATWCKPCEYEIPNLVAANDKFKAKNFVIFGVSLEHMSQSMDGWKSYMKAFNMNWTNVSDFQHWRNAVAQQYKITSIPQNFLLDPNGKIIAKNLRGEALDAKLCEILGCN